jgi:hypothetical protein
MSAQAPELSAKDRLAQLETAIYNGEDVAPDELAEAQAAAAAEERHSSIFDAGRRNREEKAARKKLLADRDEAASDAKTEIDQARAKLSDAKAALATAEKDMRAAVVSYNEYVDAVRARFAELGMTYSWMTPEANDAEVSQDNALVIRNTFEEKVPLLQVGGQRVNIIRDWRNA